MDTDDLYQRGLALRRQLFGAETVARRMDALGEFGQPLQHIVNAYSYGDVWSRPQLDQRSRSLAMIGITATLNRPNELKVHVEGALNNGVSTDEIREVLLLVAMYAGLPASIDAHKAALEVFALRAANATNTTDPRS
ncbi:MAG: carboxymuconolactone decarboxylase family protein [Proteobacteria bacterium]|nr:carboxymuconolactone decarboxylase family protein [Burkholderiales bacterium]